MTINQLSSFALSLSVCTRLLFHFILIFRLAKDTFSYFYHRSTLSYLECRVNRMFVFIKNGLRYDY